PLVVGHLGQPLGREVRRGGVLVELAGDLAAVARGAAPALALDGDQQPLQQRLRVGHAVGVLDQLQPGDLHDVGRGLPVRALAARGAPQQRVEQLDDLGHAADVAVPVGAERASGADGERVGRGVRGHGASCRPSSTAATAARAWSGPVPPASQASSAASAVAISAATTGAANDVPLQMANPELKSSRSIVRRSPTTTVGERPPCSAVGTVLTIAAPGRWVVTHGPSLVNSATEVLSGLRAPTLTIGGGPESGTAAPRGSA